MFREARAAIAESLWSDSDGDIQWCDLELGIIHTSALAGDADGSSDASMLFPPPLVAFQPAAGGGYVFAGTSSVSVCGPGGRDVREIARIERAHDGIRLNEGKCDPFGRFVVGSMNFLGDEPDGAIYSFEGDGSARMILAGVGVSNGFEWSDDGSRMYFSDTSKKTVFVGDYSESGELSDVTPFIVGTEVDGLTRDVDGGFWAGVYGTGNVVRFRSDGSKDFEFELPAGHATSVAFGGPGLSTLFIATAREKLIEEEIERLPLTGSIFAVDTATHGLSPHRFEGAPARHSHSSPSKGNAWISESPTAPLS